MYAMKADWKNSRVLLPKTLDVLEKLSSLAFLSDYTFIGGSALAFYLSHRQSEDLDFFTWLPSIDKLLIKNSLTAIFEESHLVVDTEKQQDWLVDGVKITFFANNWDGLKQRERLKENLFIGSLPLLTATKINTLFLRAKFRDYYDLYALNKKGISIASIFEDAFSFFPTINRKLFQMALIYTKDIQEDDIAYLKPEFKVKKEGISKHFEKEIAKWIVK